MLHFTSLFMTRLNKIKSAALELQHDLGPVVQNLMKFLANVTIKLATTVNGFVINEFVKL